MAQACTQKTFSNHPVRYICYPPPPPPGILLLIRYANLIPQNVALIWVLHTTLTLNNRIGLMN